MVFCARFFWTFSRAEIFSLPLSLACTAVRWVGRRECVQCWFQVLCVLFSTKELKLDSKLISSQEYPTPGTVSFSSLMCLCESSFFGACMRALHFQPGALILEKFTRALLGKERDFIFMWTVNGMRICIWQPTFQESCKTFCWQIYHTRCGLQLLLPPQAKHHLVKTKLYALFLEILELLRKLWWHE